MTQERDEAIAKVYEELGPVKAEILQRYTGSDYDKPQFKRRIGQEMGLLLLTVGFVRNQSEIFVR